MKNLIQNIACQAGINEEKAKKALMAVSAHVKEEFPLLHSVVDLVLGMQDTPPPPNEKPVRSHFGQNPIIYN